MDRSATAVNLRQHLLAELQDTLTLIRSAELTLMELMDLLALLRRADEEILRPAALRARTRPRPD